MLQSKPNETIINLINGDNASSGLTELKLRLVLLQAAYILAIEGTNRATAQEISNKAMQDYGFDITPSFTGQVFSGLGIPTATTHGKRRFVLKADQLEKIREDLTTQCKKTQAKLQAAIKGFKDLPGKVDSLQKEWANIRALRNREQELIRAINTDRQNPPDIDYLEAEYRKIQQRDERIATMKQEISTLNQKEKTLASLDEKKKYIETRITAQEKKAGELAQKEREITLQEQETDRQFTFLSKRIEKLAGKTGWVDLSTLKQKVEEARKELDQVLKQLGEKRTLLDKLLRRKEAS
jgi:chromosome segregation ATPase